MQVAQMTRLCILAVFSAPSLVDAVTFAKEVYTTNAICTRKNCINPIFPGLEDLHHLETMTWTCASLHTVAPSLGFCQGAVNYDPALPAPTESGAAATMSEIIRQQDNAATQTFFYALAGMGMEGWEYHSPRFSSNDCVKSVWRMVCYTYFPRAPIGCTDGVSASYLRPCQSSCQNYIRACSVECCDESVQCVFTHTKKLSDTMAVTTSGYLPHDGPSSLCTGAAKGLGASGILVFVLVLVQVLWSCDAALEAPVSGRGALHGAGTGRSLWLLPILLTALFLQGARGQSLDVPTHTVGNWRGEPDYLLQYEFIPPGSSARDAKINSCSLESLSQTLQCSGRGICKRWDDNNPNNPLAFCQCDRDWADPECGTKRKSQLTAFLLSMFFGFLGADLYYLGNTLLGTLKLITCGGFGVWWVVDIIRIGSAPVLTGSFRVAEDLPHWAYVLCTVMYAVLLGFFCVYYSTLIYRRNKRREAMLLAVEEEKRLNGAKMPASFNKDKIRPVTGPAEVEKPRPPLDKSGGPLQPPGPPPQSIYRGPSFKGKENFKGKGKFMKGKPMWGKGGKSMLGKSGKTMPPGSMPPGTMPSQEGGSMMDYISNHPVTQSIRDHPITKSIMGNSDEEPEDPPPDSMSYPTSIGKGGKPGMPPGSMHPASMPARMGGKPSMPPGSMHPASMPAGGMGKGNGPPSEADSEGGGLMDYISNHPVTQSIMGTSSGAQPPPGSMPPGTMGKGGPPGSISSIPPGAMGKGGPPGTMGKGMNPYSIPPGTMGKGVPPGTMSPQAPLQSVFAGGSNV